MLTQSSNNKAPSNGINEVTPLENLVAHFEIHNRAESKSAKTVQWYTENLRLLHRYLADHGLPSDLEQLNLDIV